MPKVREIFYSIQGEGIHKEIPTVFVRLSSCNLLSPCSWCDTPYARGTEGEDLTLDEITAKVSTLAPYYDQWVCITGGEPLANPGQLRELVKRLKEGKYRTEVFTNGSVPKPLWWTLIDSWVVDIKCPGSGICGVSLVDNWFSIRPDDQIKFVVQDEADLNFVRSVLNMRATLPGRPIVLISPMIPLGDSAGIINNLWIQRVVEFVKELNKTYRPVRLSLQLHKVIYGDKVGV